MQHLLPTDMTSLSVLASKPAQQGSNALSVGAQPMQVGACALQVQACALQAMPHPGGLDTMPDHPVTDVRLSPGFRGVGNLYIISGSRCGRISSRAAS